jgi:hypothetical protein
MLRASMPETSVDKNGDPSAGEDEVRSITTHLASESIAQTLRVQGLPQQQLWLGVRYRSAAEVRAKDGWFPVRSATRGLTPIGSFRRAIGTGLHTSTLASPAPQIQPRMDPIEVPGSSSRRCSAKTACRDPGG